MEKAFRQTLNIFSLFFLRRSMNDLIRNNNNNVFDAQRVCIKLRVILYLFLKENVVEFQL